MKKLLLVACLMVGSITAASAQEHEGGSLRIRAQHPVRVSQAFDSDVITAGYSNITTLTSSVFLNGGTVLSSGNLITRLVADDITPIAETAGFDVTSFTFSVVNVNSGPVSFRPRVRFWNADGPAGAPGTYYSVPATVGFTFYPITLDAFSITLLTADVSAGVFTMPGTTFWAGLVFDNNTGATGATSEQMDQLGQALFQPVTVGSSLGTYFMSTSGGSFVGTTNPIGAFGASGVVPEASYGWEFNVDLPVPARSSSWGRIKTMYR